MNERLKEEDLLQANKQEELQNSEPITEGVMVTGATTPVGCQLVHRLLGDPSIKRVLAIGLEPHAATFLPPHPKLSYMNVDLTRTRGIRSLLFGPARDLGVEAIIHTAQHRKATDRGRKVRLLNVESSRALLELSEEHPTIKRFILRSYIDVYKIEMHLPTMIEENHPLNISRGLSQWVRDRVEADLTVCSRMGLSPLHITVLRFAECLGENIGSQLYDYLCSRVCFRPLGFNPMINVITIRDMVEAFTLSLRSKGQGVYNIPGKDTLPLSDIIKNAGRLSVPVPGTMLSTLYNARRVTRGTDFRYSLNNRRFHLNSILDGSRAARELNYRPMFGVDWEGLEFEKT